MKDVSPLSPLDAVALQLRARGLAIRTVPGGFWVNYRHGKPATAYQTDDLGEALRVGLAFPLAPAVEPPLGPMGAKNPRRARMYAHNRRIAAQRRAAAEVEERLIESCFLLHGTTCTAALSLARASSRYTCLYWSNPPEVRGLIPYLLSKLPVSESQEVRKSMLSD